MISSIHSWFYSYLHLFAFTLKFLSLSLNRRRHENQIQKLSNIADQLRERKQILPEDQLISKVLAMLLDNFRIVRSVWTSYPANYRTLDHLLQRLITEESVLPSYPKTEVPNETALASSGSTRGSHKSHRGGNASSWNHVMGFKVAICGQTTMLW